MEWTVESSDFIYIGCIMCRDLLEFIGNNIKIHVV